MAGQPVIRYFVDQCVPDSVGQALAERGHDVVLLREKMAPNSPDPLVAAVSEMFDAVLVSHDSDFKSLAPRMEIGRRRFKRLSRIALNCRESQSARRIVEALTLIEHEWNYSQAQSDKRMIIEIGATYIRTMR